MARKKKILKDDFTIDNEPQEICCFSDSPVIEERCISSFSFDTADKSITKFDNTDNADSDSQSKLLDNSINPSDSKTLTANKKLMSSITTKISFGSVPPIEGEAADTRRSYILRHSTVKKIDEIKNAHPEVNVAVSTIVDMAIAHYYECIFSSSHNN
ncbi:hypothetical protein [uncultured Clostridium sp.]|uniref:hypothetical protein n=1 Tax=uncultured Clostridium sp. TaxID=59620 RepID=UPI0025EE6C6F|nr:hypothetical protein [uncultured Clostridium sp.]